jgi:hypothetical protein
MRGEPIERKGCLLSTAGIVAPSELTYLTIEERESFVEAPPKVFSQTDIEPTIARWQGEKVTAPA